MKAIGGIMAWLGGMAMLLGGLFVLLSLKNMNDLFIWTALGGMIGGLGLLMVILGWVMYQSGAKQERQSPNHWTS